MGGEYDPRGWLDWPWNNPCGCGTDHFVTVDDETCGCETHQFQTVEVPLCHANAGIFAYDATEIPYVHYQGIFNERIEVVYQCDSWPQMSRRTYEIINDNVKKMSAACNYHFQRTKSTDRSKNFKNIRC